MNKTLKILPFLSVGLGILASVALSLYAASSTTSSGSNGSTGSSNANSTASIPADIQTQITNSVQNYVTEHLPPDPSTILSYTCQAATQDTPADPFCSNEAQAWQTFLQQYSSSQASQALQFGNQSSSESAQQSSSTTGSGTSSSSDVNSIPLY